MKATIDVPDELYRKVKAKSALLGRPVREITVELYERWLTEEAAPRPRETPQDWLRAWLDLADEAMKSASPGPPAREQLDADRNRLERR